MRRSTAAGQGEGESQPGDAGAAADAKLETGSRAQHGSSPVRLPRPGVGPLPTSDLVEWPNLKLGHAHKLERPRRHAASASRLRSLSAFTESCPRVATPEALAVNFLVRGPGFGSESSTSDSGWHRIPSHGSIYL